MLLQNSAFCYICCSSSIFAIREFRTELSDHSVQNAYYFSFSMSLFHVFIFRYNTVTNVNYAANYAVILDFKTLRM